MDGSSALYANDDDVAIAWRIEVRAVVVVWAASPGRDLRGSGPAQAGGGGCQSGLRERSDFAAVVRLQITHTARSLRSRGPFRASLRHGEADAAETIQTRETRNRASRTARKPWVTAVRSRHGLAAAEQQERTGSDATDERFEQAATGAPHRQRPGEFVEPISIHDLLLGEHRQRTKRSYSWNRQSVWTRPDGLAPATENV